VTVVLTIPELIVGAIGLAFGLVQMFITRRAYAPILASYETNSKPVPIFLKLVPFTAPIVLTAVGVYLGATTFAGWV
jgi:hypothetical protein